MIWHVCSWPFPEDHLSRDARVRRHSRADLLFGLQMQPFGRMVADQWPDDVRLSDLEPRFTFFIAPHLVLVPR
jgi:hypothetical protein